MLKVQAENKGAAKVKPGKRLYLTADKARLVPEGDPDAATLYCSEHATVSKADFERLMPPPPAPPEPEPEPEPEAKVETKAAPKKRRAKKGAK